MNAINFLTNETTLTAILAGIIICVLTHFLTVRRERRKVIQQERHAIVAELGTVGHEYIASLQELQAAKEACDPRAA